MLFSAALEGAKVRLVPFDGCFVTSAYLGWLHDPEVNRFLVKASPSMTLDDVRRFCDEMRASPDDYFFAILRKSDGRHVGNVRLGAIDRSSKTSRFGIMIGERMAQGQGLASETVALIEQFAFGQLQLNALAFPVVRAHKAAMRIYEKCGFEDKGDWPESFIRDGQSYPMACIAKANPARMLSK